MQPRTRRALGFILPVLFAVFLLVIIVSWSSREASPIAGTLDDLDTGDDRAELISYEFEDTQLDGDRKVMSVKARKTVGFESGWYSLEEAILTFFRESGGTYTLEAPKVELQAQTREARAAGGVVVRSSDGLQVSTEALHFDGASLTNDIPVEFVMDGWSGRADGIELDLQSGVVTLEEGLDLQLETVEGPVSMRAERGVFERDAARTVLTGGVEVQRRSDTSRADEVTIRFDESHQRLVGMEGRGHVEIRLAPGTAIPGASAGLEGDKTVEADSFRVVLDGRGVIRRIVAGSGEGTPVRATLRGETTRSLSSDQMTLDLLDGRMSALDAVGNARVVERGPERRTIESGRINVNIAPATGAARLVLFENDVRLVDRETRAAADRAVYDIPNGRVTMTSDRGSAPSIESGTHAIRAEMIELEPETNVLRAKGRVVASISSQEETALFSAGGEPVFVNAGGMVVRQIADYAVFSDDVRVWQAGNTLFADQVQLTDGGAKIIATGSVRALVTDPGERGAGEVEAEADTLRVERGRNEIVLQGGVTVKQEGRVLIADTAEIELDASNRLQEVRASGGIELREPSTGRSASGQTAVYDVRSKSIVVDGDPARVDDANGSLSGSRINFDLVNNRVRVERGESPTEATYNADAVKDEPQR